MRLRTSCAKKSLRFAASAVLRDEAGVAANEGLTLGADYYKWARINLACAPDVARRIVDGVLALDALR